MSGKALITCNVSPYIRLTSAFFTFSVKLGYWASGCNVEEKIKLKLKGLHINGKLL